MLFFFFSDRFLRVMFFCFAASVPSVIFAQSSPVREYEVKAAFIYHFAQFVEWPPSAVPGIDNAFIIGLLGVDPFGKDINQLQNKMMGGSKIIVTRFSKLEDVGPCHILFISSSEKEWLPRILHQLKSTPTLTISEVKGFGQMGGIVNFVPRDRKIRFEINKEAAENAGLKINSQLLKLAIAVRSSKQL